jgi:hypothetical protein
MKLSRLLWIAAFGWLAAGPVLAQAPPDDCPNPKGQELTDDALQKILSSHTGWVEKRSGGERANLCNANLSGRKLSGVDLQSANLTRANLSGAVLTGADLSNAKLDEADLISADLAGAKLIGTSIKDALLAFANLSSATYAPRSQAPNPYVAGIEGLDSVTFPSGREDGLVQLRDLLQKAGHRDLERAVTYAIERKNTADEFAGWRDNYVGAADAVFRTLAFDWTTGYGLYPANAMLLVLEIWALLTFVYAFPILCPQRTAGRICFILPKDRVETQNGEPRLEGNARVGRLSGGVYRALGWAAYFSLLSAFQIGYKEFSIGAWLGRAQSRNFSLEGTGWVRSLAGIQSLISVYLLAMWLLTYFGRPFQ